MLSDLLADSNLPANVASTLKAISTMIAQPTFSSFARGVNSMSPLVESRFVPDEKICEQPDMRDDGWRSRPHHNRRMSNLFTTTTSATGMPTVERDGGVSIPNNIGHTIPGSPRSGSPTFLPSSKLLRQAKSLPHNMPHLQDNAKPNEARSSSPVLRKIPSENGAFTAVNEEKPKLEESCKNCGCSETHVTTSEDSETCESSNELTFPAMSFYGKRKPTVDEILEKSKNIKQSEEVEKLYDKIDSWNFPIFDVWENGNVLRGVAFKIFKKSGFFEKFRIREQVFLNYFTALDAGYNDIPYHNSAHAADVLHGVYYFTTQRIAGFCPFDSSDRNSDSDSVSGDQSDEATECVEQYDRLTSCIPDLERFALYSAAAMHDYDHPGRTNAFVVATLEPQALLYNDRSVLENHHAAQAFSLLLSNPEYNYVESLTTADFKRFRFLVIEAVLATDLKRHFDVLQEFTAKVDSGAGIDWSLEADRLLASQVCIKMADISGPTKQKDIHQRWTERIVEEFYEQGEDELNKGLPVSPYMDRKVPLIAQLQETFIKHLVAPLFRSYRSAGLLPGVWVTSSEYDVTNDSDNDSSTKDDESTEHSDSGVGHHRSYPGKKRLGKKKKRRKRRRASKEIHCEIMENIESNYQMWSRRIKEMELEKQACSKGKAKDNPPESGGITEEDDSSQGGAADTRETES
ncbi:cGMP-inhibited 3, 5 -cyclic phosphodiesterase A-like [Paramuricea clavata]|uniref:Phosphodiesterase n=1 Tax=Paramuricea clavata TaxID=317549 RepID=A0A7D9HWL1_PARCT|nr:cGMP-inhibited 3, 5 -cyclic phosphodiesterase A-like [Paramuricea clavata]